MRVAVLGGGAVGSLFSFLLRTGGAEVVVYESDPDRREWLRSGGLVLEGCLEGISGIELGEFGRPVDPFDLMLIAVPAQCTAEALRKVSPFVHRETYYISAQDGHVLPELKNLVGPSRSASLICRVSACLSEGGPVEVEEAREVALVAGEGFDSEAARTFMEIISNIVPVHLLEGEEARRGISERMAVSSTINAICAVAAKPPCLLKEDWEAKDLVDRACREARVALGLEESGADPFREGVWDRLMPPMSWHLARYGRTEVEYLSGDILRRGRERSTHLFVQRSLYTVVKEMEAGRLSPGEKAWRELRRRVEEDEGLGLV
jgi:ketopantoate reductase